MGAFSLEDQLTFYGAFHHNKWNQLIHIVFVPAIVWSAMVFLRLLTPGDHHSFVALTDKDALALVLPPYGINLSLVALVGYAAYYMVLDFWPGVSPTTQTGPATPCPLAIALWHSGGNACPHESLGKFIEQQSVVAHILWCPLAPPARV